MMTSAQCRAARALLDWSRERLAARAGVDETRLSRFEAGGSDVPPQEQDAIRKALEGAGVRLRKTTHDEGIRPDQLTTENDR